MIELSPLDTQALEAARPAASLGALMLLDDAHFVGAAYLTLLRRPADEDGLSHYLHKLRSGSTKIEVLAGLTSSREGRASGAVLPGLPKALLRFHLMRLPLVGRLLQWVTGAEGYSASHRHQRAVEQILLRQLEQSRHHHAQSLAHLEAIRSTVARGAVAPAAAEDVLLGELVVQPRGQTPSLLSRFIKLKRTPADDVIAQLAELVGASFEAEQLAVGRH